MPNIKIIATQDFDDVVATVAKYTEGLLTGNVEQVMQAFHQDAVMFGHSNGELVAGPIQALYDVVTAGGPAPRIRTRIDVLEITRTTAAVRVAPTESMPLATLSRRTRWRKSRASDCATTTPISGHDWTTVPPAERTTRSAFWT